MSLDIQFQRHELVWTPEKISRFWDFESQNEARRGEYFTLQCGEALIHLALASRVLVEPVLDYGAGLGYLTERLVKRGLQCSACDFSPASVASLNQRMAGQASFGKCEWLKNLPSAMPAGAYGMVFLVETLEHLLPEWRKSTLQEVGRVLKPGGHVMVTVPYAEQMDASKVMCADCGAVFHRVQHVASFDEKSLVAVMAEYGFSEVLCLPTNLLVLADEMQQKHKGPLARIRARIRSFLTRLHLLAPRLEPNIHLVYIGKKT